MAKSLKIFRGIAPPNPSKLTTRRNRSFERLEQRHLLAGDLGGDPLLSTPDDHVSIPEQVDVSLQNEIMDESSGSLHDHGNQGQFFYDAETKLYWYDPGQFVGAERNETDLFVQQSSIWNWATEFQIDALSGKASHDGSPLTNIMGESQARLLDENERWIGYFGQSSQPNGWFVDTAGDLSQIDNANSQQNIQTSSPGAWLVSQSDPESVSYEVLLDGDRVVVRDVVSKDIVLEGTDSLTVDLKGMSATVNLEGLENTVATININHQIDDLIDFGKDWIVDPLAELDGTLTHLIHKGDIQLHIVNESPFTNPVNPYDTNRDGRLSPQDILLGLNELSRKHVNGEVKLPESSDPVPKHYLDVTGDGRLSPLDTLLVLNHLSRLQPVYQMIANKSLTPAATPFATQTSVSRSAEGEVDTLDLVQPSTNSLAPQKHSSGLTASSLINEKTMDQAGSLISEPTIDQTLADASFSLRVDWLSRQVSY